MVEDAALRPHTEVTRSPPFKHLGQWGAGRGYLGQNILNQKFSFLRVLKKLVLVLLLMLKADMGADLRD